MTSLPKVLPTHVQPVNFLERDKITKVTANDQRCQTLYLCGEMNINKLSNNCMNLDLKCDPWPVRKNLLLFLPMLANGKKCKPI